MAVPGQPQHPLEQRLIGYYWESKERRESGEDRRGVYQLEAEQASLLGRRSRRPHLISHGGPIHCVPLPLDEHRLVRFTVINVTAF